MQVTILKFEFHWNCTSPSASPLLDCTPPRQYSSFSLRTYFSTAVQFDKGRICAAGLISIRSAYKCVSIVKQ